MIEPGGSGGAAAGPGAGPGGDGAGTNVGGTGGGTASGGSGGQSCSVGELGCACGEAEACDGALFCVAQRCTDQDPYTTLATGLESPHAVAADGSFVYYVTGPFLLTEIRKVDVTTDDDTLVRDALGAVFDIDAQGGYVYYVDFAGAVGRKAHSSSDELVFPDFVEKPSRISVAGIWVFFNENESPFTLRRDALTFDESTALRTNAENVRALHATPSWVYWSEHDPTAGTSVILRNQAGGNPGPTQVFTCEQVVLDIAGDSTTIWWGTIVDPTNPDGPGALRTGNVGAGEPSTVLVTDSAVVRVVTDDSHVYWLEGGDGNGRVMRILKGGDDPIVLASGLRSPVGLALDGVAVYWSTLGAATTDGSVHRRLK